jgi:hypothetical protein
MAAPGCIFTPFKSMVDDRFIDRHEMNVKECGQDADRGMITGGFDENGDMLLRNLFKSYDRDVVIKFPAINAHSRTLPFTVKEETTIIHGASIFFRNNKYPKPYIILRPQSSEPVVYINYSRKGESRSFVIDSFYEEDAPLNKANLALTYSLYLPAFALDTAVNSAAFVLLPIGAAIALFLPPYN